MKLAPYPMIDLDLAAPLDRHPATVLPDWIDWNGHMNVGYYVVAFDKATDTLCQQFGCGYEYTRDKIGMTFVLEAHVTYDREVKEGDGLRITTQILDHDAKRIHYIHMMYHANGRLSRRHQRTDADEHRLSDPPLGPVARLRHGAYREARGGTCRSPRPAQAGRLIGIKKK